MATITLVDVGMGTAGATCDAVNVPLVAGRAYAAWVTSTSVSYVPSSVVADPVGTPQPFTQISYDTADGTGGDAVGSLWALDVAVSGTYTVRVTSNNVSARRMVQIFEITNFDNTTPDAWRSGFTAVAPNIAALTHQVSLDTAPNDLPVAFVALPQQSSAPNLITGAGNTSVANTLSGTTLRGIALYGADPVTAVVGGTTSAAVNSVVFGINIPNYRGATLLASPYALTLTRVPVSLALGTPSTGTLVAVAGSFALGRNDATLRKDTAGALDPITLGTFATSVTRLFVRAVAIEANSIAPLTPSAGWVAMAGTRSQDAASAIMVRGEYRITTDTSVTSQPTIAAAGDNASVMRALVSTPSFVLNVAQFGIGLAGFAAGLRWARVLPIAQFGIGLAPFAVNFSRTRVLQGVTGAFAVTGVPALLVKAALRTLVASPTSFTLTRPAATLLAPRVLFGVQRAYALSGAAAGILAQWRVIADARALSLVTPGVGLSFGRTMRAEAAAFALTRNAATFQASTLGTPLLWTIRGRVRPVVGHSLSNVTP